MATQKEIFYHGTSSRIATINLIGKPSRERTSEVMPLEPGCAHAPGWLRPCSCKQYRKIDRSEHAQKKPPSFICVYQNYSMCTDHSHCKRANRSFCSVKLHGNCFKLCFSKFTNKQHTSDHTGVHCFRFLCPTAKVTTHSRRAFKQLYCTDFTCTRLARPFLENFVCRKFTFCLFACRPVDSEDINHVYNLTRCQNIPRGEQPETLQNSTSHLVYPGMVRFEVMRIDNWALAHAFKSLGLD